MKKFYLAGLMKMLIVMIMLGGMGVKGWGQVMMANYKFESNLNAENGVIGSPTLTASVTPSYFAGVTGQAASHATSPGKYFELLISTTGYTSIDISFAGRSSQTGSTWIVTGDATGGNTFSAITNLTCANGSFSSLSTTLLGATYDNKASIRIRITAGGTSATVRIDDLIIRGLAPTCTSPTTQASTLAFSSITSTSQTLNFTRGNGDAGVLITGKSGSAAADPPNGTGYAGANLAYGTGTAVGTGFALYYGPAAGANTATSQNVTNLAPETKYYYNFYEYNSTGTCYNLSELSGYAWTLSAEPTAQSASFISTVIAYNQINLSYGLASLVGADGYIILKRADGTAPTTTGVVNGAAAGTWSLPAGTSLVTANATGTGFSNTGLNANTSYCYLLIPYNWNGTNTETYNYRITATVPTTCGTTPAVPDPAITINSTSVVAGNINIGSSNNVIYGFSTAVLLSDATFTGVSLPTTFTSSSDFSASGFKLWYNSTNSFSGATQLGAGVDPTGANINFTGLAQTITNGSTGYFFITVDVSPSAIANNTIVGNALPIDNVSFNGNVTKSGSPSAAGLQTIILLPYAAFDDFTRADNLTVGIPSSGGVTAWTEIENAIGNNGPARIFNNQLMLVNTDNLGNAISNGYTSTSFDMNGKYATNYSTSTSILTWIFNFRSSRPAPSGFGTGNTYAMAFIIGSTQSDPISATGNGYAVIIGNSGTPDPVKLIKFSGGLNGTLTDVCVSAVTTETNYYSVKVAFDPCINLWSLQVRDDGAAFSDPTTNTAPAITATDVAYTNVSLNYLSCHFKYGASAGENCRFDNIYIPSNAASINTYTWNGTTTDYQIATNWTPARNCPKINDILVIDASSPTISNLTNVPTQTIGKLLISGNRTVSFKDASDATVNSISIGGGTFTDFVVGNGSTFNFDVASANALDAVQITLLTGATGDIAGTLNFDNTFNTSSRPHQLFATDAGSIIVSNGGILQAIKLSGAPFGSSGNSGVIVFQSGSMYQSGDGGNPFALTQPDSRVVFNTGSKYRHTQTNAPSFAGRVYANFEFDLTAASSSILFGSGTGTMTVDHLSVLNGTFNITGASNNLPVNINIKKDLLVSSNATFNYSPASIANSSTLLFNSTNTIQKINSSGTITLGRFATLELNNFNTIPRLNVESDLRIQGSLKITAGELNLSIGNITIQSDATSTANISAITGSVVYGTGRFIIERYLPAFKAWRFISTPIVIESTPTISESWREGNSPLTSTGYGVQITGPSGPVIPDNNANLDLYSIRGSMKKFLPTNGFSEITDANTTPIANKEGYFVFVTGDRGTALNGTASPTNLRIKGKILTGDQTYTVGAVNFLSVGNPFASRVDFRTIANGTIAPSYYAWNPNPVGTLYNAGKYETYINFGDGNYRLGNITGPIKNYIESGQSIIIQSITGGSITIEEGDKANGSDNVSRTNTNERPGVTTPTLEINLFTKDVNGSEILADEATVIFGENFNDGLDNFDVRKINNSSDNLAVMVAAKRLVLSKRNIPSGLDTIFLSLTSTRVAAYTFKIAPSILGTLPFKAWLLDRYLQTETAISLIDVTAINFQITSDAASKESDRFMIIFKQALPSNFLAVKATPKNDKSIALQYIVNNENNVAAYKVERSNNGISFNEINSNTIVENLQRTATYLYSDEQPLKNDNYYRVKMLLLNGSYLLSEVVKVDNIFAEPAISISPNPVLEKKVSINFINNMGKYHVVLYDINGKMLLNSSFTIKSLRENKIFLLPANSSKGMYKMTIVNEKGVNQTLSFIVL